MLGRGGRFFTAPSSCRSAVKFFPQFHHYRLNLTWTIFSTFFSSRNHFKSALRNVNNLSNANHSQEGEELTISYLNLLSEDPTWGARWVSLQNRQHCKLLFTRQGYLLENFGFSCTCCLCALEGESREQVMITLIAVSYILVVVKATFSHSPAFSSGWCREEDSFFNMALLPAKCKRHQKVSNQNYHLRCQNFCVHSITSNCNKSQVCSDKNVLLRELLDRLLDCFTQAPFTPSIKYFQDICFVYFRNIFPPQSPSIFGLGQTTCKVSWIRFLCSLLSSWTIWTHPVKTNSLSVKLGHPSFSVVVMWSWLKTISRYPSNFWGSQRWARFHF